MPQLIAIDSRLPMPDLSHDDPSNPLKVVKDLKKLENQTNADTQYDIRANLREGFALNRSAKSFVLLCGILLALVILIYPQPLLVRIVLGFGVIYGIHQILGKLEKKTV
jgi:hypothetical protein